MTRFLREALVEVEALDLNYIPRKTIILDLATTPQTPTTRLKLTAAELLIDLRWVKQSDRIILFRETVCTNLVLLITTQL